MSKTELQLPEDLEDILVNFALSHVNDKPVDLIDYAADYFQQLKETRRAIRILSEQQSSLSKISLEEEEEDEELLEVISNRRSCVAAEQHNPELEDDDEEEVFYPKTDEQRTFLINSIKKLFFFASLDDSELNRLVNVMFMVEVKSGEVIIEQGDDADNFYVIESGIYNVYIKSGSKGESKLINTYNNNGFFGELALLYNQPRAATIKAVTNGALWALRRYDFQRVVLKLAYQRRKLYEAFIDGVPLLQNLKEYDKVNLADAFISKTFAKDDCIIREGDKADGMYFIEEGSVVIKMLNEEGVEIELTKLHKNDYFGELSLITNNPRAASVYAYDNVKVAFLDVEAFERLLGPCLDVLHENIAIYEAAARDVRT